MVARAIQRNSAAIELETVAGCELDRAEAKGLVVAIDDLLALPDGGSCEVAVWRGKVPSPWIRNGRSRIDRAGGSCPDIEIEAGSGGGPRTCRSIRREFEDFRLDRDARVLPALVVDRHDNPGDAFLVGNRRRGHVNTPVRHVHRRRLHDPHIAIEPRAGIPPRAPVGRVQPDGQHVLGTEIDVRRQLHAEGLIAVRPGSHVLAVEPDFGVGHGTVEVDEDTLALVADRNREMLAVPADALPRQLAGVARKIVAEGALDPPVMGNVKRSPRGVIELDGGG